MTEAPPFSRPVQVDGVRIDGLEISIKADEGERARLARLNNLPAIGRLEAQFRLDRIGRSGVRVTGKLQAAVTQTCVVSLEPFDAEVRQDVDVRCAPAPAAKPVPPKLKRGRGPPPAPVVVEVGDDDPPDPIVDGEIDLGVLAAEMFSLALDPYPRKPDAAFEPPADTTDDVADSPFGRLAARDKKN
jgi:Large ribosomal RNA subunit accumulation protein YceD